MFLRVLRKCFFQGEPLDHEMHFCISHTWFNKWLVIFLSLLLDVIGGVEVAAKIIHLASGLI
jgi:hypothetical protein